MDRWAQIDGGKHAGPDCNSSPQRTLGHIKDTNQIMLSVTRSTRTFRRSLGSSLIRYASTETPSASNQTDPPPPSASAQSKSPPSSSPSLSRPHPAPRTPAGQNSTSRPQFHYNSNFTPSQNSTFKSVLPTLPSQFGQNQRLIVPDETRALLEEIVAQFNAPIRYAFAYGSGVFAQQGYDKAGTVSTLVLPTPF